MELKSKPPQYACQSPRARQLSAGSRRCAAIFFTFPRGFQVCDVLMVAWSTNGQRTAWNEPLDRRGRSAVARKCFSARSREAVRIGRDHLLFRSKNGAAERSKSNAGRNFCIRLYEVRTPQQRERKFGVVRRVRAAAQPTRVLTWPLCRLGFIAREVAMFLNPTYADAARSMTTIFSSLNPAWPPYAS